MIKLFENGWFVGIVTGIISGLLVFIITNLIMNKKSNKEHLRQIMIANQEVISCLKPYIADEGLPEIKVFNAIIASVARKNSVQITEMYTIYMFCEELIREVIGDIYVSNDKKKEYTLVLANYIDANYKSTKDIPTAIQDTHYKEYMIKTNKTFSVLISIIASVSITLSMIQESATWDTLRNITDDSSMPLITLAAGLIAGMIVATIVIFLEKSIITDYNTIIKLIKWIQNHKKKK